MLKHIITKGYGVNIYPDLQIWKDSRGFDHDAVLLIWQIRLENPQTKLNRVHIGCDMTPRYAKLESERKNIIWQAS